MLNNLQKEPGCLPAKLLIRKQQSADHEVKVCQVGVTMIKHVSSKLSHLCQAFLELLTHLRALLQYKAKVQVPRQHTVSVFVLREVQDSHQGEPAIT